ncbi:MAG TPA: maleylacetoacetate isomerase [Stellaceae bacterium]|jgi:maleylacetoacetate isomerase|nr:maleylacetoacetate isomerase [Stellaceae bacterium]
MRLYGYSRSSAAFRVRIALNLKGLTYENAFIHLRRGDQRQPPFLGINPQGLVPALETDGHTLVQSLPIIEYLDETHPEPPFLPPDAAGKARVRALAAVVACDIHPINNLRVLRYLSRPLGHDQAAIATWYNHWIASGFEALEGLLSAAQGTGSFCHGDRPGLADIALVPQVVNAERYQLNMSSYPTIARIFETCMKLDAFAAAHPRRQPDYEE